MERNVSRRSTLMEEVAVFSSLVMGQFLGAINSAFLSYLQSLGLSSSSIVIFSFLATFLLLSPPSVYFERNKWSDKLSCKLFVYVALASVGNILFQLIWLKGMSLTSAVIANAVLNIAPGVIFFVSTILGLEKLDPRNVYTGVKVIGTLICVSGAVMMSIFKEASHEENMFFNSDKIVGCLYLIGSIVSLSFSVILQGLILRNESPAPISLCGIMAIMGSIMMASIEMIMNRKIETGLLAVNSIAILIGYYTLGGVIYGSMNSINYWTFTKKGPVFASMFFPLSTVFSIILSYFTSKGSFGEIFTRGSLIGMLVMFAGMYFFMWAKKKEDEDTDDNSLIESDEEKPLLS